jgi:anti-sigma factor RsiW
MSLVGVRMRRREPTCREIVELVTDYFEGAMGGRERRRVEAHLAACPYCTVYVDQLRALHAALGRLEPADLSEPAERELRHAFRGWRAG